MKQDGPELLIGLVENGHQSGLVGLGLTITLPVDMAVIVRGAVEDGDYASTSEVIRAALRDWKMKRALQLQELAALKADIDKGLADVAAGRVNDFDTARIIERGRKLLSERSSSV